MRRPECAPGPTRQDPAGRACGADRPAVSVRALSWRGIEDALEAMRRISTDDELLQHAAAFAPSGRAFEHRMHEGLDVLEARLVLVDLGGLVAVEAERVLALVMTVTPFGMGVADARHVEVELRRQRRLPLRSFVIVHGQRGGLGVTCA